MKIAVTSQNFRTITGHAGKTRRFLVYETAADAATPVEVERLDLPRAMSLHEFRGDDHPLFAVDYVVTAGCGEGFVRRLALHGVTVIATAEPDPLAAACALVTGQTLPPAPPHDH